MLKLYRTKYTSNTFYFANKLVLKYKLVQALFFQRENK